MQPQNDQQSGQVGQPRTDQTRYDRSITAPPRDYTSSQRAAADLIRGQLSSIYESPDSHTSPHTATQIAPHTVQPQTTQQSQASNDEPDKKTEPAQQHGLRTAPPENTGTQVQDMEDKSPYQRTMVEDTTPIQATAQQQWQQYHTAWQQYYQQYYQRYYMSAAYNQQSTATSSQSEGENADQTDSQDSATKTVNQNEALQELRQSIRQKVTESTDKVKKSRHFIPVIAGISVLLLFMFLQYNRVVFGAVAAYVSPGNIEPQNIIVDPSSSIEVGPEPRMIIPKINIDAPVVYGVGPDHDSQMKAMESGIAHFSIPGANAVPGQIGNTVMAAHSSNDVFAPGDYKFVFAQNERLVEGDIIHMNYEGVRYTYSVTTTEVVLPTEVSKIQLETDKPMLTLISCVPLGTAQKRLLVFAEQISPDPNKAMAVAASESDPEETEATSGIPGRPSPTLIERIFGAS